MPTGPSSDSAGPPQEPRPPLPGGSRYSWLVQGGRHPVTWGAVSLVLLAAAGLAVLLHQPGGRARAHNVYCGLVTCAVLRSVAASGHLAAPRPALAAPSPLDTAKASAPSPARVPSPQPAAGQAGQAEAPAPSPTPAPAAAPTSRPSPRPDPAVPPGLPRWPWPPAWPPYRWGMGWGPGKLPGAARPGQAGGTDAIRSPH